MSISAPWPQYLGFFGKVLILEPSPGQLSGDVELLPVHPSYFRLNLHAAAMNPLVRLRRFVAEPLPVLAYAAPFRRRRKR
jgi:hypothetical protein